MYKRITRRDLLQSGVAVAAIQSTAGIAAFAQVGNPFSTPSTFPPGFSTAPVGGGGYVTGLDIHTGNDPTTGGTGSVVPDGSMVIRTDVGGAYHKKQGEAWRSITNYASLAVSTDLVNRDLGVYEIAIAPSNSNVIYMFMGDSTTSNYIVWKSTNRGVTFSRTNATDFNSSLCPYFADYLGNGITAHASEKMAIDPYNSDILYVGTVPGSTSGKNGMYRTIDGGVSYQSLTTAAGTGIPNAMALPGYAGIWFDKSSGTVTVNGQIRCRRVLVPVSGRGVYESMDGGVTWARAPGTENPTPDSSTLAITTTSANAVIIVQVICPGIGSVNSVTNSGTAALTWKFRGQVLNVNQTGNAFEYWAIAPSSGTYNINVHYNDGCTEFFGLTNRAVAFPVYGADISGGAPTIFDGSAASVGSGGAQNITITTKFSNSLIYIAALSQSGSPSNGFRFLSQDSSKYLYQEYNTATRAGANSVSIGGDCFVAVAGAIKKSSEALTVGPATYSVTAGADNNRGGPTNVWCGQGDAEGNYWCITANVKLASWAPKYVGRIFRYSVGRAFEIMSGHGATAARPPTSDPSTFRSLYACVDPRAGHAGKIVLNPFAQTSQGVQTTNGKAARDSIAWTSNTGIVYGTARISPDVPWLKDLRLPAVGTMKINPIAGVHNGEYVGCDGVGFWTAPADSTWDHAATTYTAHLQVAGIEELVAQDVLSGPGYGQPIFIAQDRMLIVGNLPNYPTWFIGGQTSGYGGDFAANNPNYCAVISRYEQTSTPLSSYSTSSGAAATWNQFSNLPNGGNINAQGGTIAVLDFTSTSRASLVVCGTDGIPQYTVDNGTTAWQNCVGLPNAAYVPARQARVKPFCKCWDVRNKGYAFAPGHGFYVTTDGGANWSFQGASLKSTGSIRIFNVPGHPNDLWAVPNLGLGGLNYSNNGGVSFSTPNARVTSVYYLDAGAVESGGTYPTLYLFGIVKDGSSRSGTLGFWKSNDRAATWTWLGNQSSLPALHQLDYPQGITGDWANPGTFYLYFNSTGWARYRS